jgi:hypothetical protein
MEVEAMTVVENHSVGLRRSRRRREELEYRWVFCCAYPFYLCAAVASRLRPRGAEVAAFERPRPSVFKEAWIAANSSIPFAFMN